MADNRKFEEGRFLYLTVGLGVNSGDPVVVGKIPGVAQYDADSDNKAVIDTSGVYNLSVTAKNNSGNSAVSVGDILYKDGTKVNKDATNGVRFGYAMEAVTSGATSTIKVKLGY